MLQNFGQLGKFYTTLSPVAWTEFKGWLRGARAFQMSPDWFKYRGFNFYGRLQNFTNVECGYEDRWMQLPYTWRGSGILKGTHLGIKCCILGIFIKTLASKPKFVLINIFDFCQSIRLNVFPRLMIVASPSPTPLSPSQPLMHATDKALKEQGVYMN